MKSPTAKIDTNRLIAEYGQLALQRIKMGFRGYLLSFLFSELGANERLIKARMASEVSRVYSASLTHVIRYPNKRPLTELPVWIACADHPVPKRERQRICEVSRNQGLHMHAVALIPPNSRLKVSLDKHFLEMDDRYVQSPLIELSCEPIRNTPARVVDYALKSLRRGRVCGDDILILPKAYTELSNRCWSE